MAKDVGVDGVEDTVFLDEAVNLFWGKFWLGFRFRGWLGSGCG